MKKNIVKTSLVAAMVLTTGAYANQIVGALASEGFVSSDPQIQFGFGGLNMDNINVNLILDDVITPIDFIDGEYPDVNPPYDSYQSSVFAPDDNKSDEATRLGYLTQKSWPISEPSGIKVINDDFAVNKYKPTNCIIGSSYLGDSNTSDNDDTTFYLNDDTPKPVLCSSYAGSSKRIQLILNENMMTEIGTDGYGKSIDLVFDIDTGAATGAHKYQVFQKVSNFTGMRLDGLKVEVLNSAGVAQTVDLNISLGLGEGDPKDLVEPGNIFKTYEMAFYPPGLWGDGSKDHLPIGWFDEKPSGYLVDGNGTSMIETGAALDGNYELLFGNWQPDKWVTQGMHIDPKIIGVEPALIAYWGTTPDQNFTTDTPAWYYGMYNNDEVKTDFAKVPEDVLAVWAADLKTPDNPEGKYVIDDIEDLPNLSLNYIVNVGANIDSNFTIRFTPKVSDDQTHPSYFEDNETRIDPVLPPVVDPVDPVVDPVVEPVVSSGGGGCTYNPNSKNFDMTFLLMMALGLLYPFRRRFIK